MSIRKFGSLLAAAALLAACSPQEGASGNGASAASAASGNAAAPAGNIVLTNVSYDVARNFYEQYNPLFNQQHPDITIKQSHGGSSKQALAVANGLQADVVTMNQSSDIELLVEKGLVSPEWQSRLPDNAVPFTSTTVFLVRKGNPQNIRDWNDLARDGIKVIISNPKTTGNGRYSFLGAYGYALKANNGDDAKAREFVGKVMHNVPVFDNGGRAATTTFVQRQIGDVLVTFENEAQLATKQFGEGQFEIVYPAYSVRMESPVAVVDSVVDKRGTREAATAYLQYLWSKEAQELGASLYLRPANAEVLAAHASTLPPVETFRPTDVFGPWKEIMPKYFGDGGVFDQLMKAPGK
ncbi:MULTISPECIES: sulfate ABC transporter substrate-binding protein [Eikenella]|uniref:Sulfate ABC transporter substrate-binding protein n=1 Tax=Eikenella longinqua TaxID=1795827 RepID=A0A1A9RXB1_9NEIS|nr:MULTISPECIES: sulfate ABC transporter substrate-binding protein [Eikenella]OAM29372.1 sulfate ABC transporter substrate-binding protein [Eikenella longinqua]